MLGADKVLFFFNMKFYIVYRCLREVELECLSLKRQRGGWEPRLEITGPGLTDGLRHGSPCR